MKLLIVFVSSMIALQAWAKQPAASTRKLPTDVKATLVNGQDPFQRYLSGQLVGRDLPYDVHQWTSHIFAKEYEQAGHLWTAIQEEIPDDFVGASEGAYLYTLWHLNLPQTFFNRLVSQMSKSSYVNSPAQLALENTISTDFENFLLTAAIVITPVQQAVIERLDNKHPLANLLKARVLLRKGEKAESYLSNLPDTSRLKVYLTQTAVVAHLKKHDLVGAAKLLKVQEKAIETMDDPLLMAQHYLTVARTLYQAGQPKNAVTYYEKVPNSSPFYVPAQEELSWALLRMGETSQLRGELATLTSPVFKSRFAPEVYLVRAISNLKMCFYDAVQKDFEDFTKINGDWAHQIETALNTQYPGAPPNQDAYSTLATNALVSLTTERQTLTRLEHESITATLPAVGPQKHWKDALKDLDTTMNFARQWQAAEFHRQWSNDRVMMIEAVRKMRFVKVEYMSEVRRFSGSADNDSGTLDKKNMVAANDHVVPEGEIKKGDDQLAFPVDKVFWPDEMFRLRSTAQSRCLSQSSGGTK